MAEPRDGWSKTEIMGKLIGAIVVPIVVLVMGFELEGTLEETTKTKREELKLQRAAWAVDLLRGRPTEGDRENDTVLRQHAIDELGDSLGIDRRALAPYLTRSLPGANVAPGRRVP